jgi:hypothetical protein
MTSLVLLVPAIYTCKNSIGKCVGVLADMPKCACLAQPITSADPLPPPPHQAREDRKSFEIVNYHPPPHCGRRAI